MIKLRLADRAIRMNLDARCRDPACPELFRVRSLDIQKHFSAAPRHKFRFKFLSNVTPNLITALPRRGADKCVDRSGLRPKCFLHGSDGSLKDSLFSPPPAGMHTRYDFLCWVEQENRYAIRNANRKEDIAYIRYQRITLFVCPLCNDFGDCRRVQLLRNGQSIRWNAKAVEKPTPVLGNMFHRIPDTKTRVQSKQFRTHAPFPGTHPARHFGECRNNGWTDDRKALFRQGA